MIFINIEINDVVQIVPTHQWSGNFVTVTEVKSWGIVGYVQIPLESQAYIRLEYGDFEKIGKAVFIFDEDE